MLSNDLGSGGLPWGQYQTYPANPGYGELPTSWPAPDLEPRLLEVTIGGTTLRSESDIVSDAEEIVAVLQAILDRKKGKAAK